MATPDPINAVDALQPHTRAATDVCERLQTRDEGLDPATAGQRLQQYGPNRLPRAAGAGLPLIFARQFANPLIYILLLATLLSVFIGEWADAIFILAVLLLNAIIGAVQEYQAQRSAEALEQLVSLEAVAVRDGIPELIRADELVPGDVVLLESGNKVPADLRLLQEHELDLDESLFTGESLSKPKDAEATLPTDTPVADRSNMVFGGTLVLRGRGRGVVTATGEDTELGKIATDVHSAERAVPPLMRRMKTFTTWVGIVYLLLVSIIGFAAWMQGQPFVGILLIAVALAVAAIPEGLPVAITVALAVGMSRMAKVGVIIRRLVAAETLGSCTLIAADKTGTLTVNRLTASTVKLPTMDVIPVSGEGDDVSGSIAMPDDETGTRVDQAMTRLGRAAVFANEGNMVHQRGRWQFQGDTVDIALLILAWKAKVAQEQTLRDNPVMASIPFESEQMYSASLNRVHQLSGSGAQVSVKGAVERVLPMCSTMLDANGDQVPVDADQLSAQAESLAQAGYRVLALADKMREDTPGTLDARDLSGMCFLGLVGMIDPPRPEARQAIAECRQAGLSVVMITGDHPTTAKAIARKLDLVDDNGRAITGQALRQAEAESPEAFRQAVLGATIFARIEPHQKLQVVNELQAAGHYVAVTGDGANDAPALRVSHVGVAMGQRGTDVARESAEIIITDDNFASLVAGIREGRIAYSNVRKVIFLLISTGAVEIVAFILAMIAGLPLPLTAIQLLWLNLVTEGIQHVGLAFEPGEGNEMRRPPRPPSQPIFDRLMIERVVISALTMGTLAFMVFWYQYSVLQNSLEASRNIALLFLVMFENVQVFNSRSETTSITRQPFFNNRLLLAGTFAAQAIHIIALYTPGLSDLLDAAPVSLNQWLLLMATAMSMILMMELHKWWWTRRHPPARQHA